MAYRCDICKKHTHAICSIEPKEISYAHHDRFDYMEGSLSVVIFIVVNTQNH